MAGLYLSSKGFPWMLSVLLIPNQSEKTDRRVAQARGPQQTSLPPAQDPVSLAARLKMTPRIAPPLAWISR
jgi:hypothetical protein